VFIEAGADRNWRDRSCEGELRVRAEDARAQTAKPWGGLGIGRKVVVDPWTNVEK
jgi:hypothetical protein